MPSTAWPRLQTQQLFLTLNTQIFLLLGISSNINDKVIHPCDDHNSLSYLTISGSDQETGGGQSYPQLSIGQKGELIEFLAVLFPSN